RQLDFTDQRNGKMIECAGQERITEQPTTHSGQPRDDYAGPGKMMEIDTPTGLTPGVTTGDVLQDKRHGGNQARDETATREIMPAQENVHRYHQGQRQNEP